MVRFLSEGANNHRPEEVSLAIVSRLVDPPQGEIHAVLTEPSALADSLTKQRDGLVRLVRHRDLADGRVERSDVAHGEVGHDVKDGQVAEVDATTVIEKLRLRWVHLDGDS